MKKIRITTNRGHLCQEVEAHVFGTWAAHVSWDSVIAGDEVWTVSDIKSGLAAFIGLTFAEAMECARRLGGSIEAPEVVGDLVDIMKRRHSFRDVDPYEFKYLCESIVGEVFE